MFIYEKLFDNFFMNRPCFTTSGGEKTVTIVLINLTPFVDEIAAFFITVKFDSKFLEKKFQLLQFFLRQSFEVTAQVKQCGHLTYAKNLCTAERLSI